MKKTRFLRVCSLAIAVTLLVAALAGCGGGSASRAPGNKDGNNGDNTGKAAGTLKLGIVDKGYGDEFLKKLAEGFEKKTGIKTVVEKSSSADWVENAMQAGAANNDLDVIFDINPRAMKNLATKDYVAGYDRIYVDLSDIYDAKLEGYTTDMTLKEALLPYSLTACTWGGDGEGYGDGKQYFVNWAAGIEGIVYNKALFEKYKLSVPKTTDELFAVMDQMKKLEGGKYAKNSDGYEIYPFAYSGKVNYLNYPATVWWAQYDGIDVFNNALQGKDANGNYSAESAKTAGKLSAMNHVSQLLSADNQYTDPNSASQNFTNAQVLFLAEQSFMMSTGDWIEREMSSNFEGSVEIEFMRIPVNSNITSKCSSISNDAQLSEVVAYIDGDTSEKPAFVSEEDLAFVTSARSMYCSEGNQHIAYIPAYSNNIEAGKQFLSYMLSKEGQEIVLEYSYGNMAPLNIDIAEFDYASSMSSLQKSKFELLNFNGGATLVGTNYVHPMNYAGGVELYNAKITMEIAFGGVTTSATHLTPKQLWQRDYDKVAADWNSKLSRAGVSN